MSKNKSKDKAKNFAAVIATGAGTAGVASGVALKSAGFYTLPHSVTGATMLASKAAGIIANTAGVIGTGAAILMSPLFLCTAGAVAVAGVGYGAYQLSTKTDDTEEEEDTS